LDIIEKMYDYFKEKKWQKKLLMGRFLPYF
jgi:hypothetical protein